MQLIMSIKIAITCFFLFVIASPACLSPTQVDGKCTNCTAVQVLISGSCYLKLRGCLRHAAGPICIECQNGYVLNRTSCVREAEFNNNTNLSFIPPVVITPAPTLTMEDIRNKLGEQYGAYVSEANDYFISRYPEVSKGKIKNVDRLETKKGTFLAIEYQGQNLIKYQAVSFVNNSGYIREWSFSQQTPLKTDPVTANTLIRNAMGDKLKDNILYQMKQEGEIYIFDYMNGNFQVTRVVASKADLYSAGLYAKLRIKSMGISEFAQEAALEVYPYLQNLKVSSVQKFEDYYVLSYGPTVSVSFKFSGYNFLINNPLQIPANVFNTGEPDATGSFTNLTNLSQPRLTSVIDYLVRQFPDIIGSKIFRVQSQTVAGTNYIITVRKTLAPNSTLYDQFEFKAGIGLDGLVTMFEGKKNGKLIFSSNYNYNADPTFFANYKIVETETSIANIPPIKRVEFKLVGAKKAYKVIYSDTEYSEFQYLSDINKLNLLSYYVDGENLLVTLSSVKQLAQRRSNDVLLKFLQDKDPLAQGSKIKQVIYNLPSYTLIIVAPTGTYSATIIDKGELIYDQMTKLSDVNCYTMTTGQVQESQQIRAIDSYLKNNYPLIDYSLQLVQISVKVGKIGYRLLYSNLKLKQIEIYLEEANNTASVIKASYLNYGYSLVDIDTSNTEYQKIVNYLKSSTFAGEKVPFFTESNSTVINAYYDDGKSIIQIFYDKLTDKATSLAIYTRSYLLLPDGFALDTLLLPGGAGASSPENATIAKLALETSKKYTIVIKDANIVYADKKNATSYLLMYKSTFGYLKIDATIDSAGKITIGRLVITGYVDGDLAACTQFSQQGRCLSCDKETEIEFQGSCFKKLEGCLIQAANICVKCNVDYVKSASKCLKECSAFFK